MKFRNPIFLLTLLVSLSYLSAGAVDRYWVGPAGGTYSNAANWNTASDGSGASGAPMNIDNLIIDRNATILIDGNYFPSSLKVINSAFVQLSTASNRTFTIGGGSVSPAFLIEAGSYLEVAGTAALTLAMNFGSQAAIFGVLDFTGNNSKMEHSNGSVTRVKTGGMILYGGNSGNGIGTVSTLILEEFSVYEIYKNGGTFPTGTYHPNSLIYNTGAISSPAIFLMNSTVGSYGNYQFECPDYTGTAGLGNMNVSFNEFSLVATGTGKWVFSSSPSSAYTMTVNSSFTINPDAVFEVNSANSGSQATTIRISGDVSIDGLVTETGNNTGSVLELAGSQDANFYATETGMENDISLTINKTGGAVVYSIADLFMSAGTNAKLTLTGGCLDVSNAVSQVVIRNAATGAVIGGSVASHVIGAMRRFSSQAASYSFPVSNTADQFARAVITTASNDDTEWTVDFQEPNLGATTGLIPGTIDQVSDYYWSITRDGISPSDASNVTLHYGALTNPGVLAPSQLKVVHYNGVNWQNMGGVSATGSVTSSLGTNGAASPGDPISEFGDFALGGALNTLPVEIEYFTGVRSGKIHKISWKLSCTSTPSVNMTLERSNDARNFSAINSITADGERCTESFSFSDNEPVPGKNFYRLAVKDIDGNLKYSRIITLINPVDKAMLVSVYPNPANGRSVAVTIASSKARGGELVLIDGIGRQVLRRTVRLSTDLNNILLDISGLQEGQYRLMMISDDGEKQTLPLLRVR